MTSPTPASAFAHSYGVELLCRERPTIRKRELLSALWERFPAIVPLDQNPDSDSLAFVHTDHFVKYSNGSAPAQVFMAWADKPLSLESLEQSLQQSWGFPKAREGLEACKITFLVTDLLASALEYRTRLMLFQNALAAVLAIVPCQGIHWQRSQQVVEPVRFLSALEERTAPNPFAGAINVRFFKISDRGGEMLMDTLGLSALGLCDVQCHFRGIEPNVMARFMANLAVYLFDHGDVINDGHTVEGIKPGSKWKCQHEQALAPPARIVLDVNPGAPHAAGNRSAE
jgi:hypothetical protein